MCLLASPLTVESLKGADDDFFIFISPRALHRAGGTQNIFNKWVKKHQKQGWHWGLQIPGQLVAATPSWRSVCRRALQNYKPQCEQKVVASPVPFFSASLLSCSCLLLPKQLWMPWKLISSGHLPCIAWKPKYVQKKAHVFRNVRRQHKSWERQGVQRAELEAWTLLYTLEQPDFPGSWEKQAPKLAECDVSVLRLCWIPSLSQGNEAADATLNKV